MPIIATGNLAAVNHEIPTEVPLKAKVAQPTTLNAQPVKPKMRSFVVTAGQETDLEFEFQNEQGNPYDLTEFADCSFTANMVETVKRGFRSEPAVEVIDAERGKLRIKLTPKNTKQPAIYICSVQCFKPDAALIAENTCYVYIRQNPTKRISGPPDILEIRLQLRDSSPDENLLLDGLNFSDEEIAIAVRRPIEFFNELQPDVGVYYTTANFPYRYHWIEGIIGQLYRIIAEYHRKNNLQYSAGGVSLNDLSKEPNYLQIGEKHWMTFVDYCKRKKVEINLDQGYALVPSGYSRYW